MDETIYVIFKVQFDFALEVWFSIYVSRKMGQGGEHTFIQQEMSQTRDECPQRNWSNIRHI